jgi:hypothetical protein
MGALAVSLPPEEPIRVGFRLYERFRRDVPDGEHAWGANGEFRVERIVGTEPLSGQNCLPPADGGTRLSPERQRRA